MTQKECDFLIEVSNLASKCPAPSPNPYDLTGYGDEPLSVIQCFNCGELLDNTISITRDEAEKALERSKGNA